MLDASYAPIYNTWGLIKVYKGDVISALRYFQKAITLDPDLFEAQMNFGEVTISFRGYEDGREAFARAVALEPESLDVAASLNNLGIAAFNDGDLELELSERSGIWVELLKSDEEDARGVTSITIRSRDSARSTARMLASAPSERGTITYGKTTVSLRPSDR